MNFDVRIFVSLGALSAASLLLASSAQAAIVETYEAPGRTTTTATFVGGSGIEAFDSQATGTGAFTSTFGASGYTGTYSSALQVSDAGMYGGAGGTGKYAVVSTGSSYSVTLNKTATYFGYWLSAADVGNSVAFFNGQTLVGSLNQNLLVSALKGNSAYFGNPSGAYAGQNAGEAYAFVNFYDNDTSGFNRVVFTEGSGPGGATAGYESDNHTVGNFATVTGTVVATVPEPTSYALVLAALAGIGVSRRKSIRV